MSTREMLKEDELCGLFIGHLMKKKVGFSVPRACRRYLSGARSRLGLKSLNDDIELRDLVIGYERSMPRTVVQALSLQVDDVMRIAEQWGSSRDWWYVNIALMVSPGFVCIMRMAELPRLGIEGVVLVLKSGEEVWPSESSWLPVISHVQGAFVHLVWRKASQSHDVWIPVSCGVTLRLLLRQLHLLRLEGRTSGPLLTSRTCAGGKRSKKNHLGHKAAVDGLRDALRSVCDMSGEQSLLYKGHSLRVGGSNHMRLLGVSDEVHRLMGGWASLVSSRGYFQLSADELIEYLACVGIVLLQLSLCVR